MRVSILMPVFNAAAFVDEALESVSAQTFSDFELVAIDDGSTDGSYRALARHAAHEPRMRLVGRENRGLVATRNELLAAARGELVAWMDSDDITAPERIALQVARFDAEPGLVCVGTAARRIGPEGEPMDVERYPTGHAEILLAQQRGGAMRFPTTMMRRQAALDVGGFRRPFPIGEDFDLLLRLSEIGTMANLPEVCYCYRQHLDSVCGQLAPSWPAYRDAILGLAAERRARGRDRLQEEGSAVGAVSIAPAPSAALHAHVARTYAEWARHALGNRNRRLAWKYARSAIAAHPGGRAGWAALWRVALGAKRGWA